jgi:signal transduction histidine kinase
VSLKLAKALGGEIKVESEVNKGSTFTITLSNSSPAAVVAPAAESHQQEECDI